MLRIQLRYKQYQAIGIALRCLFCLSGIGVLATADSIGAQAAQSEEVRVLNIQYLPEDRTKPGYLDPAVVGQGLQNTPISTIRAKVAGLISQSETALESGTQFRAYKNEVSIAPYLNYVSVRSPVEYTTPLPPAPPADAVLVARKRPDYRSILTQLNICDWVDNKGVDQVWVWGYHHGNIEPVESNMAMGRRSRSYWNHTTFGDVSNSEQVDDLPTCNNTYTLFNYNYERGLGEVLEDHTHQLERLYNFLQTKDPAQYQADGTLFWNKFVGAATNSHAITTPRCGWTHFPPNSVEGDTDYNWYSTTTVASDCMDWKPDGSGNKTIVSCETWGGPGCPDDGGVGFKIWWMRSIPGYNSGLTYQGKALRNWWVPVADFDRIVTEGGGLLQPSGAPSTPTPPPTVAPIPLMGDFSGDGVLDRADVALLTRKLGVQDCAYNFQDTCVIDLYDYNHLLGLMSSVNIDR